MWDQRYSSEEYAYGTEPNEFLASRSKVIPKGRVLSLAEGEGRNAVFLAKQGYQVTAVDGSRVGLDKAARLAEGQGVELELVHADLAEFEVGINQWEGIVSIFCPLPPPVRQALYRQVQRGLKSGGVFLLEAYTPEQLRFGTGGGDNPALMQNAQSLKQELPALQFEHLAELERSVIEGRYHTGLAAVVQAVARAR